MNLPVKPLQATYRFCASCKTFTPAHATMLPVCSTCGESTIWVSLSPLKYEHRLDKFQKHTLEEQDHLLRESWSMMCVYRSDASGAFLSDCWAGMIGEDDRNETGKWGIGWNGLGFSYPYKDMWEALENLLVRYKL